MTLALRQDCVKWVRLFHRTCIGLTNSRIRKGVAMLKKTLAVFGMATVAFGLIACGEKEEPKKETPAPAQSEAPAENDAE